MSKLGEPLESCVCLMSKLSLYKSSVFPLRASRSFSALPHPSLRGTPHRETARPRRGRHAAGQEADAEEQDQGGKGRGQGPLQGGPSWALESCEWRVAVCVCRPHIGLQKGGSAVQTSERKHDPRSSTRYAASCCFCLLPVSSCKGDCPVSERLE